MKGKMKDDLQASLDKFDVASPIVINMDNTIIGGHQRYFILKDKGVQIVDVRVPSRQLSKREEKELNLRLNKNIGEFALDSLSFFDEELLQEVGFDDAELEDIFDKASGMDSPPEPEVEFSEELLLEHNYVILYFDNPLDWQVAVDKFGLKKVKDFSTRKAQSKGVGRVVRGADWLDKIHA
jgi:hypothetical protein